MVATAKTIVAKARAQVARLRDAACELAARMSASVARARCSAFASVALAKIVRALVSAEAWASDAIRYASVTFSRA